MTVSYYLVRVNYSRGAKHGERQWQKYHWTVKDAQKGARKHNQDSIELRWINRAFQTKIGWTREYCRYLDFLTTIDISYCATWKQRSRYENSFVLGVNDGPHPGPMREGDDFPKTIRRLSALQREQGRVNAHIPKEERERQRPFNETLRADLEWHRHTWRSHWLQASSSSSTVVGVSKMARTTPSGMVQPTLVGRVMATDSFQSHVGFFFHRFRVQTLANVVHATGE